MVGGAVWNFWCVFVCRDDASATAELNGLLYSCINDRLKSSHVDPNLVRLGGVLIPVFLVFQLFLPPTGFPGASRNVAVDGVPGYGGFLLGAAAQDRYNIVHGIKEGSLPSFFFPFSFPFLLLHPLPLLLLPHQWFSCSGSRSRAAVLL